VRRIRVRNSRIKTRNIASPPSLPLDSLGEFARRAAMSRYSQSRVRGVIELAATRGTFPLARSIDDRCSLTLGVRHRSAKGGTRIEQRFRQKVQSALRVEERKALLLRE